MMNEGRSNLFSSFISNMVLGECQSAERLILLLHLDSIGNVTHHTVFEAAIVKGKLLERIRFYEEILDTSEA